MERKNLMSKHNKTKQELILELEELKQKYDSLERVYLSDIESHKKIDKEFFHQQAEELLSKKTEDSGFKIPESDILKLNHELQTHQVELELQNEELLRVTSSLQQNESQYKSLFANNHSVMLLIDPETGEIKDANVAACFYYGWSHGELCKKNISDINTLSSDELAKELQRAKAEKRKHFFFKHCLANGEVRDVEIYSGPIHYGGTTLLYSLVHDITDRKIAEEKLHESEEKYSKAFQTSPYAIGITRLSDGKFLEVNDAFTTISGYSREEILANTVGPDFWVNPEDRNEMTKLLAEGNEVSGKEYQFRNKSGGIITGIFSAQIISLENEPYMLSSINDISAHKMAEDAQHESNALYKAIIHASPDNITITDLEGKVLFSSPKALEMFGFENMDQLINHHLIEFIVPEDRERAQSEIIKMHQGNDSGAASYRAKKADDTIIDIDVNGEFIRDENGTPTRMIFIVRDITERKKTEKALQLSEEKYRSIFETMLDVYYEAGLDGKVIDISPSIEIISKGQYTRNELIGKQIAEVYSDFEDQEAFLSEISKSGKVIDYELLLKNKDGLNIQVSISAGLILDKKGHPVKIAGTMRDITERKQTQEALIKNKIRLQQMAEQSGTVIWEIDSTGMYTYVSPVSKQVWDYSPEELVGKKHFYDLHPKEGREEFKLIALQAISKKEIFKEFPNQVLTKSNKLIWVSTNGVPILDHEGNLIGYRGADYDITDSKLAENALNDKNNLLTNLIVNMQEGILLEDADRKIALTNQLFCNMFSIPAPPEVMIGADCTSSAEESKHFFKNPDKFIADINLILTNKKAVFNDALELVDGRHFQRDYIPTYLENQYSGHLWKYRDITELKNAEASLKKLSHAIEQSPVMTYITGISGMIEYVNPKMLEITGYSEKELLGQNPRIFGSGERPKEEYKELWQTITSGKEWKGEFHNKKKNRELYWVSSSISAVSDDSGNITHFLAIQEDITNRKQAEENIKEQNDRLKGIISAMPDLIFAIDKEGTYTEFFYANPLLLKIPKEDIIGTNLTDFFGIEKADDYLQHIHECIRDQKLITYEYEVFEDNRLNYFEARIAPYGKDKILSVVRNVTVNKEKDLEVKKLSLAVSQSPVTIVITDTEGNIEYANPAFELATGYSLEEVMGKNPRMLKSGKTDEAIYKDLWKTISNGKEWHGEWINKKKNGEFYWEDVSITPVYGENKKITNYLAIKQDITQRKQSEKEILELNASLEQKVKDRTAEFKEALNRLNKIANLLPGMVYQYLLRPDGTSCFPYSSEGINDIYRVNPQEVADDASPVFANLHPDDFDGVVESIQASASNLEVWKDEYRVKFDDGTIRWLFGNATPQKEADGSILWHGFITDVTERKQVEEELAVEKQRLASILEGTNVGTWEWNVQTGSTTFNERWADIIGYTLEEISPVSIETWIKFAHPDDLKVSGELLEQHFKGELDYYSFESRMKHKDGSWIWILDRGKVHEWDADGKPMLMSGTHQDITTRKQAEAEIEESKERHRGLSEAAFDSIFFSEKGICVEQNLMAEKVFGYTTEEAIGRYGTDWIIPEHRKIVMDNMMAGAEEPYEVTALRKDGTTFPCMLSGKMMNYKGRNVRVTSLNDITELKLAEEELKWNQSLLNYMSNSSPLGLLVVDNRNDDILYFNHRFCEIWEIQAIEEQMQRGEFKNNDIIPYCLPVLTDVPAFAESCEPLQYEDNRIVLEDEISFTENRTVRRFSTQIRGENDEYYGRFYIFENISERKLAEAEILKAKNEAENANRAKSEFLSRMSHELRTPLNSILGFAQLMEMSDLIPSHKKRLNHILSNGKHLLKLINEVLDIAGIESGKQMMNIEPVLLIDMINQAMDVIQGAAHKRGVTIELVDAPSNNFFVMADKLRLKQVLLNLMSNAVKYNDEKGLVKIKTELQPLDASGNAMVRLSISDTGIGINPDNISKLFQSFERIGADKTEIEGTGLGLMLVRKFAEAMGGAVGVESKPDVGSTFWVDLPQTENKDNVKIKIEGVEEGAAIQEDAKVATILYIEDNLSNIELVEEILADHRPSIQLVTSIYGGKTIKLAKEYLPKLILLDLNLPDMKGDEVLKKLLADSVTKTIPVIMVSANAIPSQIKKLMKIGAVNYLTKPLDIIQFLKNVDQYTEI